MEIADLLISVGEQQRFGIFIEAAHERDAVGCALLAKAVWDCHLRVTGQVGGTDHAATSGRSNKNVDITHDFREVLHVNRSRPVSVDVVDCRDEARSSEGVRPGRVFH